MNTISPYNKHVLAMTGNNIDRESSKDSGNNWNCIIVRLQFIRTNAFRTISLVACDREFSGNFVNDRIYFKY